MKIVQEETILGPATTVRDLAEKILESKIGELIGRNDGGIKLLGAVSLARVLSALKPDLYIELGAWKGLSSVVAEMFLPSDARMFVFEPGLNKIEFRVDTAKYTSREWATPAYGRLSEDSTTSLVFADDHQDVLERLLLAWSRNYDYVLFDDDYSQSADHRTFRNSLLGAPADGKIANCLNQIVEWALPIASPRNYLLEIIASSGYDQLWRDQILVKLSKPGELGWTMGRASWDGG